MPGSRSMRGIAVLGSTGSVGQSALEVISEHPDRFRVELLSARRNWRLLAEQALAHRPRRCLLADPQGARELTRAIGDPSIEVLAGWGEIESVLAAEAIDTVLVGVSGSPGLPATHAAILHGKRVALANKESLVMAGEYLLGLARETGASVLPVDSEHSAVFQALRCGRPAEVRRVILTASGGPFRATPLKDLESVTPAQALRHPVWSMGRKITVDSATMMNKALEIVEARWLFGLRADQIEVAVHPQSIVHAMVEFRDGAVLAQMSLPDMKLPIQFALSFPERLARPGPGFRAREFASLTFEEPDLCRFPALRLGFRAADAGGTLGAVLNAANEVAVERFLAGGIPFPGIASVVEHVMDRHETRNVRSLEEVRRADRWARREAARRCDSCGISKEG